MVTRDGENRLYNPYSILSLLDTGIFKNYWFETATPSFLMDFIKNNHEAVGVLFKENTEISGDFPNFHQDEIREANYHILFLSWFRLMGFFALGETPASKGTPDIIIKKDNLVVICEIKYSLKEPLNDLAICSYKSD